MPSGWEAGIVVVVAFAPLEAASIDVADVHNSVFAAVLAAADTAWLPGGLHL